MSQYDTDYFAMRAEKERAIAERSTDPILQAVHRQMAELYESKLAREAPQLRMTASR